MKIKEFISKRIKRILLVLITAIIASGISVYATVKFKTENITYTPSDSSWEVKSINEAFEDLYTKKISYGFTKELLTSQTLNWTSSKKLTYDASKIEGYENLTIDNFVLEIKSITATAEKRDSSCDFESDYRLNYDSSTGLLTSAGYMVGRPCSLWNGMKNVTYNLYLVKRTIE